MRRLAKAVIGLAASVGALAPSGAGPQAEEIRLGRMGSFHVGGKLFEISGKPVKDVVFTPGGTPARIDPNGTYVAGQMYVQYFIPSEVKGAAPLLFWHGGGMTGVNWETTPDGRTGWRDWFLSKGWPVYVSDAVERGRAGWAMSPEILPGEPLFLTTSNPWERFRIGEAGSYDPDPAKRRAYPGSQFPVDGYDQFNKQIVPRWVTTDALTLDAYLAEIDKVCPCILVFHSQAGQFGFKAAQARPDKVKALVAIEPAGIGDPAEAAKLKDIPILLVYGDYIDKDRRWPTIRRSGVDFVDLVRKAGGSADVVDLPARGIRGNSHMMMMDRNNLDVAALVQDWLAAKGLAR